MNTDMTRATWRKSSKSPNNNSCVEVGAVWRKSSRSPNNASCVEVADLDTRVAVRDTKDRSGPVLLFGSEDWTAFLADIHEGTYDLA